MQRARLLNLEWKYFGRFVGVENIVERISKIGDASATDNGDLNDNLLPVHIRLKELIVERHYIEADDEMQTRTRDRTTSYLSKWPTVRDDFVQPYVGALSSIRAAERGKYEHVGSVIRALRFWWNPKGLSCWAAQKFRNALEGRPSPKAYGLLVGSLSARLEPKKTAPKYPPMNKQKRCELLNWYKSADGKNLYAKIKSLIKIEKMCARIMGSKSVRKEDLTQLPVEANCKLISAIEELGKDYSEHWLQIIEMKRAALATHACWLYKNQFLNRLWNIKDVNRYIMYSYRT